MIRGNGFKLKKGKVRLDIKKKFFIFRLVRHWSSIRGTVHAQVRWDFEQPGLVEDGLALPRDRWFGTR